MLRLLAYLLDMVVAVVAGRLLGLAFQRLMGKSHLHIGSQREAASPQGRPQTAQGLMARDPVCGMFVSTELSHRLTQGTQTLHFCSRECLERFEKQGRG